MGVLPPGRRSYKNGVGRTPHHFLSLLLFYQVEGGHTDRFGGIIFLGDSLSYGENRGNGGLTGTALSRQPSVKASLITGWRITIHDNAIEY